MGLSLTPYIVDTKHLNEVIGLQKKDYSLFYAPTWREVNKSMKFLEINGITGKMIYEDIITQNYRFTAYETVCVYTLGLEAMIKTSIDYNTYNNSIRYQKLLNAGKAPEEIDYILNKLPRNVAYDFVRNRCNNEWVPCNSKVMKHLPYRCPINIPLCEDYYISTIYNHEFDDFLNNLDLSDCTDDAGNKEFRSWFELAREYQWDVVLFVW